MYQDRAPRGTVLHLLLKSTVFPLIVPLSYFTTDEPIYNLVSLANAMLFAMSTFINN